MFIDFFYLLRERGIMVSTTEWLTLMDALQRGLHGSTMSGFYYLCRAILCTSETEYDEFQQTFLDFFHEVFFTSDGSVRTEIPAGISDYINSLEHKEAHFTRNPAQKITKEMENWTQQGESAYDQLQQKAPDADFIYSGAFDLFPSDDAVRNPNLIRIAGKPRRRMDLRAPKWDFKDFREDNVLSIRQFQIAFRRLCLYSDQFGQEEELDINRTIHDTCQKGGMLQIRHKKPRRNTIKVLLLIDSGGTMSPHSQLCSRLFQAASRSNRFKDLKIYYFHNCIDEFLYTNPTLRLKYEISTQKVFRECDKDYKVILVGDGTMDVNELITPPLETTVNNKGFTGQEWFQHLLSRYHYTVWLTPFLGQKGRFMGTWGESYDIITDLFDMYPLTVAGLDQAMKKLMAKS